jgi:gliding motility-associated-like protein
MPNAFSPNGDGVNDIFRIPERVFLQLDEFSIFDRWGNRVFSTHNISEGWNGTFSGNPVNAGTFVYYIKGSNEKGSVLLTGTVLLIR